MPKRTAVGIYLSIFAFLLGFAFVWEMIWLAVVSTIAIIVIFIIRGFREDSEYTLTAAEVEQFELTEAKKTGSHALQTNSSAFYDTDSDMGLRELISVCYNWLMSRMKKGSKHGSA